MLEMLLAIAEERARRCARCTARRPFR